MSFNDGTQPMIWRDRDACEGKTQPEIIAEMTAEALEEGYEPSDLNYAGKANLYLRGQFNLDQTTGEKTHLKDGFVMFVQLIIQ